MEAAPLSNLHRFVWSALMAALVAVGAYVQIPLGPVPFTLQTFFVFMAGFVLGPVYGPVSLGLYLLAGVAGLPVFAGGASGVGVLFGPTGGYLAGFVAAAWLTGLAAGRSGGYGLRRGLAYGVLALVVLYGLGVVQLKLVLGVEWTKAVAVGVAPFILQGIVKMVLAAVAGRFLAERRLSPQ